jgi:hypothetical protein
LRHPVGRTGLGGDIGYLKDLERESLAFWESVGIDPIRITTDDGDFHTLRCYLRDEPVFLGSGGRIEVFRTERALVAWLVRHGERGHDLAAMSTWPIVLEAARNGELTVWVDTVNVYAIAGVHRDLLESERPDGHLLEQAGELFLDAGSWAGDDAAERALHRGEPLGRLVAAVTDRREPAVLDGTEAAVWKRLVDGLTARFRVH